MRKSAKADLRWPSLRSGLRVTVIIQIKLFQSKAIMT